MTGTTPPEGFHVICPGSTSNIGPGFDTLGMAVDRYLTVHARAATNRERVDGIRLERTGTLADLASGGDPSQNDLLVSTLLRRLGQAPFPLVITAHADIPIGRGLGSSAAARVAGEVLAALMADRPVDRSEIMAAATAGEGHPDNVAPAVMGGLVAAGMRSAAVEAAVDGAVDAEMGRGGQPDVRALRLSPTIGWGFAAPSLQLATHESRAALPASRPRDVVTRSLSRLARLIPALADPGADGEHLNGLLDDELHVPHRLPLIPGGSAAVQAALGAGAWAVTLSGAGSGLIALGPHAAMEAIVAAMCDAFDAAGTTDRPPLAFVVHPEFQGVRWGAGEPPAFNPRDRPSIPRG